MKTLSKRKKGDMNFWLVMLIIALIFMVAVFFVMRTTIEKYSITTDKIQDKSEKDLDDFLKSDTSDKPSTTETNTG